MAIFDELEKTFAELNLRIISGETFEESLQCEIYQDLTEDEKEIAYGTVRLLAETRGTSKEEAVKFVHEAHLCRQRRIARERIA